MLSLEEVQRIAHLARIEVDAGAAAALQQELNGIFAMIEQMRAVDTSGVEPMSHPQDVVQRLREDRVTESDQHAKFQEVAPQVEEGLYLVPRVVE
ncbi:Asp-tRNA(Asn)/Glu-tRNA(Gln) amidotransferase subunit GatC [Usitatibacter palustris]|uniref:Aspartyl/glutamyl-tRNA(Asn/Gln) amidotransferase subunit C n=1 Tax=Usitatibacter palustris TaxID=2732487 RepID=A0A6M4HFL1_9PROT|nr:Asp-tRNA(Asn)/Glu-tRNA(Gln) amidotransferase subunit GatC [Usitatibacter palustris]QJR16837.1 Glutamyl-tRNA(Gln) amidotransferase subunit C [Usitatibacter palustris]